MKQQYVHRFSQGNLHEFTPKSQPDLKKWSDMVTLNNYPHVKDGDGLAKAANGVLTTYQDNKAVILRTNSVPRTPKKEAEHLIVAMFARADFTEITFARFVMQKGQGISLVYSHRIAGKPVNATIDKWLKANGPSIEKELMAVTVFPKP